MKIQMQQIINFPNFYEKVKNHRVSFKTSYHLAMLANEVDKQYRFYQEQLQNLLNEYGQKNDQGELVPTEDGQGIKLIPQTMNECYAKLNELGNIEVILPDYYFTLDELQELELSPIEISAILPFIKE